jgi:hypothetical protein
MTELDDIDDLDEGTVFRGTPVQRLAPSRKAVSPRMKVKREDPLVEEDW